MASAYEDRYRRLFEYSKVGILILDAESGRVADVNACLQELLGYSRNEFVGKPIWELQPFFELVSSAGEFRSLAAKKSILIEDLLLLAKDHRYKQVEFNGDQYNIAGHRIIQCMVRDLTARKTTEDSLKRANEDLMKLVVELQWRDAEMKLLNRLNSLLLTVTSLDEAYEVIALIGAEIFAGQSGTLAILNPDRDLEVVARWGDESVVGILFPLESCWGMRSGQPYLVTQMKSSLLCTHFDRPPEGGYLCVPLTVQSETLGLLTIAGPAQRRGEHQWSQQELAVAVGEAIKHCLSNIKLRATLREQAIHDSLTGLFNRRYLEETLPRELHRTQRTHNHLGVVMLDLDHFKGFNDTHGHEAGDTLLKRLGELLHGGLRKSDIACRYGGEEFVLILPDCTMEDAYNRVEQIRAGAQKMTVGEGLHSYAPTTLSAGIASSPEHGCTARELLSAADEALYAAKTSGRDRVVLYESRTTQTQV